MSEKPQTPAQHAGEATTPSATVTNVIAIGVPSVLGLLGSALIAVWLNLDKQLLNVEAPLKVIIPLLVVFLAAMVANYFTARKRERDQDFGFTWQRWIPAVLAGLCTALFVSSFIFEIDKTLFSRTIDADAEVVINGFTIAEESIFLVGSVIFGLWAIFGYVGVLVFIGRGPAFAAQRVFISRAERALMSGQPMKKPELFQRGEKIYALWQPMLIAAGLVLWNSRGGSEIICGWILLLLVLYSILVLGLDSGVAFLAALAGTLFFGSYIVIDKAQDLGQIDALWGKLEFLVFETGMGFTPILVEIGIAVTLATTFGCFLWHLFVGRFGFQNGDLSIWTFLGGVVSLPSDDYKVSQDPTDTVELVVCKILTIIFQTTKTVDKGTFMHCVPYGAEVHALLLRASSRQ